MKYVLKLDYCTIYGYPNPNNHIHYHCAAPNNFANEISVFNLIEARHHLKTLKTLILINPYKVWSNKLLKICDIN